MAPSQLARWNATGLPTIQATRQLPACAVAFVMPEPYRKVRKLLVLAPVTAPLPVISTCRRHDSTSHEALAYEWQCRTHTQVLLCEQEADIPSSLTSSAM